MRMSGEVVQEQRAQQRSEDGACADDSFERLMRSVTRQPLHRELLLGILGYCETARLQRDVEDYVLSCPENGNALLSPYRLIQQLVKGGGLVEEELDAEGNRVTLARKEGLSEDELDDLVQDWRYKTTEVGSKLFGYFDPEKRMDRLSETHSSWGQAFCAVLEYCQSARTRDQLETYIDDHRLLEGIGDHGPMRPSVLMDKLEAAGMLRWEGGWCTSEAGRMYLGKMADVGLAE